MSRQHGMEGWNERTAGKIAGLGIGPSEAETFWAYALPASFGSRQQHRGQTGSTKTGPSHG